MINNATTSNGAGGGGSGSHHIAPLGVAELAELGGDVPHGETGMCTKDGIDVPPLTRRYGHQRLVARLPPRAHVLAPLLESPSQGIGRLLVEAVQRVAVDVVPHLGLVDVGRPRLLRIPKHLVRNLNQGYNCNFI